MRFRFLRWIFDVLLILLTNRRVEGVENLPPSGPYIAAANHMSVVDIPLGYSVIGGPHVSAWAANKHRRHPFFGLVVRMGGGIFIKRGEVDRKAIKAAIDWLKAGNVFALSPEGTRSRTGSLLRGKPGTAYLAQLAQVPIVPLAMTGTESAIGKLLRLQRPELLLRVGKPFTLPPISRDERNAALQRNADEIMCQLAALLPPAYHGVYRDHPRLKELLAERQPADTLPDDPARQDQTQI